MVKFSYVFYCGEMFRKVKIVRYIYQYCCLVKKFFFLLGSNDQFKEIIIKYFNKLVEIFGDRESDFIKQMCINYDLIEVNGGWCFLISQRKFVLNFIKEFDIGKEFLRVFIEYEYIKELELGYFKEILENSFSQLEIVYFCEYFICLFNCCIK